MVASVKWPALGTTAGLVVTDADALVEARSILVEELDAIDRACSRFRPDSEISRLNRAGGRTTRAGDLFLEAIEVALRAARVTEGDVDPTVGPAMRAIGYDRDFDLIESSEAAPATPVPALGWESVTLSREGSSVTLPAGVELDLGATAKALAADRAAERINQELGLGVLVNLGGDISTAGVPPAGGWRLQVSDDHRAGVDPAAETVRVRGGGVATSSTTVRRWVSAGRPRHHIVDPRSGESAPAVWRTVTVAAASCVDANIASTAAVVRGKPALRWLQSLNLPSRLVDSTGGVRRIAGWPAEAIA
jgi:thiamine biosynthesis lipoprotein